MKKLFLLVFAGLLLLACKKESAENKTTSADTAITQNTHSDTVSSTSKTSKDSLSARDSINTKTHIGGRRTSNINTGNSDRNVNAAMSDTTRSAK